MLGVHKPTTANPSFHFSVHIATLPHEVVAGADAQGPQMATDRELGRISPTQLLDENAGRLLANRHGGVVRVPAHVGRADAEIGHLEPRDPVHAQALADDPAPVPRPHLARPQRVPGRLDVLAQPLAVYAMAGAGDLGRVLGVATARG